MTERVPFSQLWVEEEVFLQQLAMAMPEGSTYVELGTAQGGSAYIFGKFAGIRGVKVYSFDIAPTKEAYHNLANLDVRLHVMKSVDGARSWTHGPIDTLFIDAGHTFYDVFTDFSQWICHLRPGGRVIFHDYDPIERGSVVHLGVRLFCETLLRYGNLLDVIHHGRILTARIEQVAQVMPAPEEFAITWQLWGDKLKRILTATDTVLVGNPNSEKIRFVQALLNSDMSSKCCDDNHRLTLSMERPFSVKALEIHKKNSQQLDLLDDWTLCYLIQDALEHNNDLLLTSVPDRNMVIKLKELIEMLFHASGGSWSIESAFNLPDDDLSFLSARCARELLRLHFLEKIANNLA